MVHHSLRDSNLHGAVRASACRIEDNPDLVVDQVVRVIGKEWVQARSRNPCRLRIPEAEASLPDRQASQNIEGRKTYIALNRYAEGN
jgi:hypothetical protein